MHSNLSIFTSKDIAKYEIQVEITKSKYPIKITIISDVQIIFSTRGYDFG